MILQFHFIVFYTLYDQEKLKSDPTILTNVLKAVDSDSNSYYFPPCSNEQGIIN